MPRTAFLCATAACAAALLSLATATAAQAADPADRPAPPTARWLLETLPGISSDDALADMQPAVDGDASLTATDVSWQQDVRLIGSTATGFNGSSSSLSAPASALDTAESFSLAAWVRFDGTSPGRVFASKAGALEIGFDQARNHWQAKLGPAVARSVSAPRAGLWTHVAVSYDAAAHTLTLWVDGVAESTVTVTAAADLASDLWLGRGARSWWRGNLAEVSVWDRALSAEDFTGRLVDGFQEPGLLRPIAVGRWDFEAAAPCYEEDLDPTLCSAPDVGTGWDRQLTLTKGSYVSSHGAGSALALDDRHWVDDPSDPHFGEATQEYARTQHNVGDFGNPVWQDGPVLRVDQSFSLSVWVRLDPARGEQTVVSQQDGDRDAVRLAYRPAAGGQWRFQVAGATVQAPATAAGEWHHLVGVLDAARRQALLYVDGAAVGVTGLRPGARLRQATDSLLVGRSTTPAGPAGWLFGEVDDLGAYQGVLSAADIHGLSLDQSF